MKFHITILSLGAILVLLCQTTREVRAQDVVADTAGIVVGAIRWDWTGGGTVNEAVEKALDPLKWHYRIPFFWEIINDSTISASCATQECVDREILYAKENGLDYWAFQPESAGRPAPILHSFRGNRAQSHCRSEVRLCC